jgi:hypothetical protein
MLADEISGCGQGEARLPATCPFGPVAPPFMRLFLDAEGAGAVLGASCYPWGGMEERAAGDLLGRSRPRLLSRQTVLRAVRSRAAVQCLQPRVGQFNDAETLRRAIAHLNRPSRTRK